MRRLALLCCFAALPALGFVAHPRPRAGLARRARAPRRSAPRAQLDDDDVLGEKKEDYYAVLGVEREASPAEIKAAFKSLSRKYHPDLRRAGADGEEPPDSAALDEAWRQATIAYQLLSDERLRKKYDNERRAQEVGEGISAVASVLADFVVDVAVPFVNTTARPVAERAARAAATSPEVARQARAEVARQAQRSKAKDVRRRALNLAAEADAAAQRASDAAAAEVGVIARLELAAREKEAAEATRDVAAGAKDAMRARLDERRALAKLAADDARAAELASARADAAVKTAKKDSLVAEGEVAAADAALEAARLRAKAARDAMPAVKRALLDAERAAAIGEREKAAALGKAASAQAEVEVAEAAQTDASASVSKQAGGVRSAGDQFARAEADATRARRDREGLEKQAVRLREKAEALAQVYNKLRDEIGPDDDGDDLPAAGDFFVRKDEYGRKSRVGDGARRGR